MRESCIICGRIQTWVCRASECEVIFSDNKLLSVDPWKHVDDIARDSSVVCFCELENCKHFKGAKFQVKMKLTVGYNLSAPTCSSAA